MGQFVVGTVTQSLTPGTTFLTYNSRVQPLIIFMCLLSWSSACAPTQTLYCLMQGD